VLTTEPYRASITVLTPGVLLNKVGVSTSTNSTIQLWYKYR